MHFVRSMLVPRKTPAAREKNVFRCTAAEAQAASAGPRSNLSEIFAGADTWTKPYLDTEAYQVTQPSALERDAALAAFKLNVARLMEDQPGFDPARVLYGERQGKDVKKDLFKVSFRAWIPGFKVRYCRMPALIKQKGPRGGLLRRRLRRQRLQADRAGHQLRQRLQGARPQGRREGLGRPRPPAAAAR